MTTKDDKKLKDMNTMTAGVSATKLETGASIDLHGHTATITYTDAEDTTVQYANLARRTFDTHSLNSYLDLKTFPVGTTFERNSQRNERAVIEAVTGDCCYQVQIHIGSDTPRHETFSYADFIVWHMSNTAPGVGQASPESLAFLAKANLDAANLNEEADRIIAALEAADEDKHPFETELQKRVEELTKENHALKADLLRQHDQHVTEFLAKNAEIARLEAKAAILNPGTTHKEVETLSQKVGNPEARRTADLELSDKLSDNWVALNITVADDFSMRQIILSRDLPAEQPKVRLHADEVAYHIGAVPLAPRPPVRQPPMPAGQVIMGNQSVSRALTHNGPKPGDTKRIPTLAELQQRKADDAAEIDAIMQRGRDAQEALRRQFSQSPKFPLATGAQPS